MIYWEESSDQYGFDTWLRCISCSHWGLIVTATLPRWINIFDYERGVACIRIPS